jgi:hypothetical protein
MSTIKKVGAWATRSTHADPSKTVQELLAARCNFVSIMCNDIPDGRVFEVFDQERIVALALACKSAGIEVHLTSWIRPYSSYIDQAADELIPLFARCHASLLVWDAEEPWTQADSPRLSYSAAASRIADRFVSVPMGVTAIGSVSESKIEALAQVCGVWIPQAYATTESDSKPGTVVPYCLKQWRDDLGVGDTKGEPRNGWIVGLAGYDLGTKPAAMMQPPVDDALAAGLTSVCYWTLPAIHRDADVLDFVSRLREPDAIRPAGGGVMPVFTLDELPRGVENWALRRVQGLLASHGCDPGELDGLPGPKTAAALAAFQDSHGGEPGVVDGNTWLTLLGA